MAQIDIDHIWQRFIRNDLDSIARELEISRDEAVRAIAKTLLQQSQKEIGSAFQHAFDGLLLAFVLVLGLIFVFVSKQNFPHGLSDQVVVIAPHGLPRFHVITASDVQCRKTRTISGSLGTIADITGHYPIETLQAGVTVQARQLSAGTIDAAILRNREVLSLPTKGWNYKPSELPIAVSLYVAPRVKDDKQSSGTIVIRDVFILANGGGWTSVAVDQQDVSKLSINLGNADFYVADTVH